MTISLKIKRIMLIALLLSAAVSVSADGYIDPGTTKWINVGSLQSNFAAGGVERAWNNVYYEGMRWPAWYSYTDNHVIDRQWMVCKNFTNSAGTFDYLGVYFTPSSVNPYYGFPVMFKQTARFETPTVEVDYTQKIADDYVDDYHDDGLSYDRKIVNVFNSYLGVEYKRVVYAYSQQYHDNYFITEYTLTNTGNTDDDDEIEISDNQIDSLVFGMMPRYATCREAGYIVSSQMTWGKDQWVSFMDNRPSLAPYNPDSLRCFWTWFGQNSDASYSYDNIGAPDGADGTFFNSRDGRITSPQFAGIAVLHADKSADDHSDNPRQPATLAWHGGDSYPSVYERNVEGSENLYDMLLFNKYFGNSEDGTGKGDTIPMVGSNPLRNPYGDEKPQADFSSNKKNDGGGAAGMIAFGPYNLSMGDSVKIVLVEAVAGMGRHKCVEVGRNYLTGNNMILPNGSSTSNIDQYKNEWVYTGRDSLFQTFKRARAAYENGLEIPNPPKPPTKFAVYSQGDNITLSWLASESESSGNFGGYRIYRALGEADSFYHEIFACGAGTDHPEIVYEFKDRSAVRGFSYYYYIVAFSDGSNNTDESLNPTGELTSSRAYTQTNRAAYLRRQQGQDLNDIRIVPNPYNLKADSRAVNASQYQFPGVDGFDKVMFYNIPGKCKIRIYSERGDLVEEIIHEDGSGDQEWKLTTSSGQIVVSGIYIIYVEVTQDIYENGDPEQDIIFNEGESIFKKLIVIR